MLTTLRRAAVPALLAGALVLSGCSAAAPEKAADAGVDNGTFPVTITSSLGDAVIPEKPERIVTLGQGSAETAIALGTTPVGVEEYPWGADDTGYLPWVYDAVTAAGDELPELIGANELDIEAIAALEPNVILAPWSGITQEQFDTLSAIAPTVAYPDLAWSTDWDAQISIIGEALGQSADAADLVTDLKQQLADEAAKHPDYAGVTFSYVYTTADTLGVFLPSEQRVAMVSALGLTVDPVVDTFEETPGTDSAIIGFENADKLNGSDLIFTFYSDADQKAQALANPLYASIPAIANDAVVASDENSFVTGSSMINPLTVPWALERYVPLVDAALANIK